MLQRLLETFIRIPFRWIFYNFLLPTRLTPAVAASDDDAVSGAASITNKETDHKNLLERNFSGKRVLVVGGTKGIGASIVDVLRQHGNADVAVVGRSASPSTNGISADLSSVRGCLDLIEELEKKNSDEKKKPFSFVVFTVGVWPDFGDPYTEKDGVHKVVALDLLSRHVILSRMIAVGLLDCKEDTGRCVVMSVLASTQLAPPSAGGDVRSRIEQCRLSEDDGAKQENKHGFPNGLGVLFDASTCHDAWLRYIAQKTNNDKLFFAGTFPGIMATDVMGPTLPGWIVPIAKAFIWPIADRRDEMGTNHAKILLAIANSDTNEATNNVSYWAAPLLSQRKVSPLSDSIELGRWTYDWLEDIICNKK